MRTGKKKVNGSAPRFSVAVGNPADALGLAAAMKRFIAHRAAAGNTPSSLDALERYIRDFIVWADERAVSHPEHVSLAVLERYQRWLYHYRKKDGKPLSISSQRAKLTPLRGFFKWLTKTGAIPANPAAELELPRKIRRLPRYVLTAAEVEQVLAGADTSTVLGLRDRAMLEVLYATGMRRAELAGLEIGDIDAERRLVLIRQGKGRKDRLIPLGARALHWVEHYIDRSREYLMFNPRDLTLFLGNEGLPLSPMWLSNIVAQYVTKAETGKRGACHLFRHTAATLMLENGADIRFIQAMLGHAELSTTQIYTQVAVLQLARVHAQTHPGARLREKAAQGVPAAGEGALASNEAGSALDRAEAEAALFAALAAESEEEDES